MTFRLPFQILRAVSRPTSPNQIFIPNSIRNAGLSHITFCSLVDANNNNNRRLVQNTAACFLRQRSPQYPSFRRFIKTDLENRKKVRRQNKCHEKKCDRRLEFRQTTRENCEQCIIPVPDKCPKLRRLKPTYDDSKLKWKHEDCVDFCADSQRADDVRGYKIVKKKLPKLEPSEDCEPCAVYPTKAPKLGRPEKLFNYKTDPKRICPENLCNIDPPRMDDVVGVKVVPKELPKLPKSDDCPNCVPHMPKYAPKLIRPQKKYNYKTDPKRICPENLCNIDPPRMDDVRGYKITPKELPILEPSKDCKQCIVLPTKAPKLCRPKKLFNYKTDPERICPENLCNIDPPRMDDVVGLKFKQKSLPKIPVGTCQLCARYEPTFLPKLNRPKKLYDDSNMKFNHHCPIDICEPGPERMDKVRGHKIQKKKLPKLKPSKECTFCRNQVPTTAPKLCRPKILYNYKKDQERICPKDLCNIDPPRMDDVLEYKVIPKKLPSLEPSKDCMPCTTFLPTKAPKLCRPKKLFNYKTDPERICPKDTCNIEPPRMDNVVGLKVLQKKLPKLPKSDDCPNCVPHMPKYAPKLIRPTRKYNYKTDPKRNCFEDLCNIDPPRMDDVVGYKVISKKLPKIPAPNDCQKCINFVPKYAPELKRPKRNYNYKLDKPRICPEEQCDLDPPRMDDVLCWKPKKKILPSLNCQTRQYSTFASPRNRVIYSINSAKNYLKLREKAFMYSRRYSKSCKKSPDSVKPKNPKRKCPKFKLPECKPCARKYCYTVEHKKCTKVEAPYTSFGDQTDGFYEKDPSECVDHYQVMLQPYKQRQGHFCKLKAPPPKFSHIDPSLERKCLACRGADVSEPLAKEKKWVNPCPSHKLSNCAERARKHCLDKLEYPECKKLEAPYKSFSDHSPQFPELELNECDLADKIVEEQKDNGMVKRKITKTPDKKVRSDDDACQTKKYHDIERDKHSKCGSGTPVSKCHSKEGIKSMICKSKTTGEKLVCVCKPVDTSSKSGTDTKSACGSKCGTPKASKSNLCGGEPIKKPKMKCGDSACGSKSGTPKASKSNLCEEPKKEPKMKCGGKKESIKAIVCTSKESKKKYICLCKPAAKCQSKGSVECKPKKVSSISKCTKSSPKSICKESSKTSCGFKLSDMKPVKPVKAPSPSPWERICAYFRARPNCPPPHEWKQKQLEEKARKAAAAAGLKICEPKCNYITIKPQCQAKKSPCKIVSCSSKCKIMDKTSSPSKTSVCNPNPKKITSCKPKKCTSKYSAAKSKLKKIASKCSRMKCKSKKSTSKCCTTKGKQKKSTSKCCTTKGEQKKSTSKCCTTKGEQKKSTSKCCTTEGKQKKSTSKCSGSISNEMSKTRNEKNCKPSTTSKTAPQSSGINQKKHFCTYVAKNKYFSANSRYMTKYNQMKKQSNHILTSLNKIYTVSNSLHYSNGSAYNNISRSYLRLNNNYVGKIFELKLQKIGVKNALIPQNAKDDAYTICHVCKVIPKHQLLFKNSNSNMNINIKISSERRQNI